MTTYKCGDCGREFDGDTIRDEMIYDNDTAVGCIDDEGPTGALCDECRRKLTGEWFGDDE